MTFDPKKYQKCVGCGHAPHHEGAIQYHKGGYCPVGIAFVCFGPRKRRDNCDCAPCMCGGCLAKMGEEERNIWVGWADRGLTPDT